MSTHTNPVKTLQRLAGVPKENIDGKFGKNTFRAASAYLHLSDLRAAHFFAQCHHESGGFRFFEENLNYTKVDTILKVFSYDFDENRDKQINPVERLKALSMVKNPEKLANFVYANQNGNGNEASGDGWKFRGRGPIQLTGRRNYQLFFESIGRPELINTPEVVADRYAFDSAVFFFDTNRLWDICDQGVDDNTIRALTRRINGPARHGLAERTQLTRMYFEYTRK